MALIDIIRSDTFENRHIPSISITPLFFEFNVALSRLACLDKNRFVKISKDEDNRTLGFKFYNTHIKSSYTLTPKRKITNLIPGFRFRHTKIIKDNNWIKAVSKLSPKDRNFEVRDYENCVIQLCPAFEVETNRESQDIHTNLQGIYRYRSKNREGDIVYIGKGIIRNRLMEEQRKDWYFDVIQYSIISNPADHDKWESYWIQRFKEDNHGKLPYYNKISGSHI